MKILIGPLLFAFALVPVMSAQTETFDIVSFVRPAGFNRTEPDGILLLQNNREIAGLVQNCQIFIFPATPGHASPAFGGGITLGCGLCRDAHDSGLRGVAQIIREHRRRPPPHYPALPSRTRQQGFRTVLVRRTLPDGQGSHRRSSGTTSSEEAT